MRRRSARAGLGRGRAILVACLIAATVSCTLTAVASAARPSRPVAHTAVGLLPMPERWCGALGTGRAAGTSSSAVQLVYAAPRLRQDRARRFADLLQHSVGVMDRYVADAANGTKTLRFAMGTRCGPAYVDLAFVSLSPAAGYEGVAVRQQVSAALPAPAGERNYLVFVDGVAGNLRGASDGMFGSSEPGPENPNNHGGIWADVWGERGADAQDVDLGDLSTTLLHEAFHTLGAVQNAAPHSTQAGHCTQGADLMCYDDGGPGDSGQTAACAPLSGTIKLPLDCGGDDYFSPSPAPGSYLASHWNIYNSSFLAPCAELPSACASSASNARRTHGATHASPTARKISSKRRS